MIQRVITPRELEKETENIHKWFKIRYTETGYDSPSVVKEKEYNRKKHVLRILEAETTSNPNITVLEVVDE